MVQPWNCCNVPLWHSPAQFRNPVGIDWSVRPAPNGFHFGIWINIWTPWIPLLLRYAALIEAHRTSREGADLGFATGPVTKLFVFPNWGLTMASQALVYQVEYSNQFFCIRLAFRLNLGTNGIGMFWKLSHLFLFIKIHVCMYIYIYIYTHTWYIYIYLSILSYLILSCLVLSYLFLPYLFLSYLILFYLTYLSIYLI